MRCTATRALPVILRTGILSRQEAETAPACLDDEDFAEVGFGLVSAWARRPG